MKWFKFLMLTVAVSFSLLVTNASFTQEKDSILEDIFNSVDTNKDGKISREEWNAIDTNKDDKITQQEWKRYTFKSSPEKKSTWFDIKWFDNNGDGYMDKEEFFNHNKRQP